MHELVGWKFFDITNETVDFWTVCTYEDKLRNRSHYQTRAQTNVHVMKVIYRLTHLSVWISPLVPPQCCFLHHVVFLPSLHSHFPLHSFNSISPFPLLPLPTPHHHSCHSAAHFNYLFQKRDSPLSHCVRSTRYVFPSFAFTTRGRKGG